MLAIYMRKLQTFLAFSPGLVIHGSNKCPFPRQVGSDYTCAMCHEFCVVPSFLFSPRPSSPLLSLPLSSLARSLVRSHPRCAACRDSTGESHMPQFVGLSVQLPQTTFPRFWAQARRSIRSMSSMQIGHSRALSVGEEGEATVSCCALLESFRTTNTRLVSYPT